MSQKKNAPVRLIGPDRGYLPPNDQVRRRYVYYSTSSSRLAILRGGFLCPERKLRTAPKSRSASGRMASPSTSGSRAEPGMNCARPARPSSPSTSPAKLWQQIGCSATMRQSGTLSAKSPSPAPAAGRATAPRSTKTCSLSSLNGISVPSHPWSFSRS